MDSAGESPQYHLPKRSEVKNLIKEKQERLTIQWPCTEDQLRNFILMLTVEESRDATQQPVPTFLRHITQVNLVTQSIVDEALKSAPQGVDMDKERMMAYVYPWMHDSGRAFDHPKHPQYGVVIGKALEGFPPEVARFAAAHDKVGFGIAALGREALGTEIMRSVNSRFRSVEEREMFFSLLREGTLDLEIDKIVNRVVGEGFATFGLAGMSALVADVSKAYNDPNNKQIPSIALFDIKKRDANLQRQIEIGRIQPGSDRFVLEKIGNILIAKVIDELKTRYGVDYQKAVSNAQAKWPEADSKLITDWGDIKQQHESKRMANVLSTILGITETEATDSDAAGAAKLIQPDMSA